MERGEEALVARWESVSGKHWVAVLEDHLGTFYVASSGGGSLGRMTADEARAEIGRRVALGHFQPDANTTPMRQVA